MVYLLWKAVWKFLKKFNIKLSYDPEIPFLGKYPKELTAYVPPTNMYTNVQSSTHYSEQPKGGNNTNAHQLMYG